MAKRKKTIKRIRRKIRYRTIYIVLKMMIFLSNVFPRVAWIKWCGFLGGISYYLASDTRKIVVKHLTMVYAKEKTPEEIRSMSKRVFIMLGRNAGEVIRGFIIQSLPDLDPVRDVNGLENLQLATASGKPIIFLTSHLGAFEIVASEVSFRGYKPYIIGTRLKDEKLHELLWSQREKFGAVAIERGKDTIKLIKNLKSRGSMAILIDQDTKVKSRFVDFMGIPAATPIGAALFALKTNAVVLPVYIHLREDFKQEINFYPIIEMINTGNEEQDLVFNTQRLNDSIESEIRKYPEQWVWMHERWKTKPGQEIV